MLANAFWWAKRMAMIGLALAAAYFYARWQGERADHANTRTAAAAAALKSAAERARSVTPQAPPVTGDPVTPPAGGGTPGRCPS